MLLLFFLEFANVHTVFNGACFFYKKILFTNSKGPGSWLVNVALTLQRREREKNNTRGRAIEIKKEEGGE